jgi:hypothetical protein
VTPWRPALPRPPPEAHRFSALPATSLPNIGRFIMEESGSFQPGCSCTKCLKTYGIGMFARPRAEPPNK